MARPVRGENKNKPFKAALNRLLSATGTRPDLMDQIALKLAELAATGDVPAIKEIGDRMDGKVPQAIGGTDELPAIRQVVTGVRRKDDAPTIPATAIQNDGESCDISAPDQIH